MYLKAEAVADPSDVPVCETTAMGRAHAGRKQYGARLCAVVHIFQ